MMNKTTNFSNSYRFWQVSSKKVIKTLEMRWWSSESAGKWEVFSHPLIIALAVNDMLYY